MDSWIRTLRMEGWIELVSDVGMPPCLDCFISDIAKDPFSAWLIILTNDLFLSHRMGVCMRLA